VNNDGLSQLLHTHIRAVN